MDIGINFEEVSKEIALIFDICELWLNIESLLNNKSEEAVSLFSKYFTLDGIYSFKDTVFHQVSDLKRALEVLKDFYESKKGCYESNFSLILLRVSYNAVLLYEKKQEWFEGKEKEISDLLTQIVDKVSLLDSIKDAYDKTILEETKIFVYKFNTYCKETEVRSGKSQEEPC